MTDRLTPASHPNRPLPSTEVFLTAQAELLEHFPESVDAAFEGIHDVASLMSTPLIIHKIGSHWAAGDFGSVDWFLERSQLKRNDRAGERQVLWERLAADLRDDPTNTNTPHLGYMLIAQDITAMDGERHVMNFVFGVTNKNIGQSVQSIYRLLESGMNKSEVLALVKHISRHEFGHVVGLDETTITNQDSRDGLYRGHCANECTMQQQVSVNGMYQLARRLEHSDNSGFCGDCASYLSAL